MNAGGAKTRPERGRQWLYPWLPHLLNLLNSLLGGWYGTSTTEGTGDIIRDFPTSNVYANWEEIGLSEVRGIKSTGDLGDLRLKELRSKRSPGVWLSQEERGEYREGGYRGKWVKHTARLWLL